MQPRWDSNRSTTKQFTRQAWTRNNYRSRQNRHNHQQSLTTQRTTSTTLDVQRCINGSAILSTENYDNEYNEQYVIAFNKWYKGKGGKGQWNHIGKGKGKDTGGN
eukprot:4357208-Amphidinium_carterae.1